MEMGVECAIQDEGSCWKSGDTRQLANAMLFLQFSPLKSYARSRKLTPTPKHSHDGQRQPATASDSQWLQARMRSGGQLGSAQPHRTLNRTNSTIAFFPTSPPLHS
jgi:hypothetical protein